MRIRLRRGTAEEAAGEAAPSANDTISEATAAPAPTAAAQPEIIQKLDAGTRKIAQSMGIPFPALIAILIGECGAHVTNPAQQRQSRRSNRDDTGAAPVKLRPGQRAHSLKPVQNSERRYMQSARTQYSSGTARTQPGGGTQLSLV